MAVIKYGELTWNENLQRTDLYLDPDLLKQDLGLLPGKMRWQASEDAAVEENAFQTFTITLLDVEIGAIPVANIDISGITVAMEKSTGGGAFSNAGITQPIFAKANGQVYCSYQFLIAEWAMGDMYRLSIDGIIISISGNMAHVPGMVWCNMVVEALNLQTAIANVDSDLAIHDLDIKVELSKLSIDVGQIIAQVDDVHDDLAGLSLSLSSHDTDIKALIGIPATDLAADIASVVSGLATHDVDIKTVLGMLSADVGGVGTQVDNLDTKVVNVDIALTAHDTDIKALIGTPATDLAADISGVKADTEDIIEGLEGESTVVNRVAGRTQVRVITIELQQGAGTCDLMTGMGDDVLVEGLLIRLPNVDVSDDVDITGISIQTNDVTPQIFIPLELGTKANLTAEAQLMWSAPGIGVLLKMGKKIQLTITGGPADVPTVCDVVVKYRAVVSGGYLQ